MKRRKRLLCLLLAAALSCGCAKVQESKTAAGETSEAAEKETEETDGSATKELFAMDTYMTLTANNGQAEEAVEAAAGEIERIDALLSTGKEDSEISKLNRLKEGAVSEEVKTLVKASLALYSETDGLFDITIYPVMREWGFTDGNFRVPEKEELKPLLSNMGADKISLDEEKDMLTLGADTEIDLGGIAKGYTSNRVMDIFKEYGVTSGVISLGGNVQTLGSKTDGSKWRVAVQKPGQEDSYAGVISVENKAVITSGGYERYFEEGGRRWHHIIDPRTGYPAESGLASVTVVSEDGTLADGLSTSLFIMGKEEAVSFWRESDSEFEVVLIDDEENIFVSEGLADSFSSDYEFSVIEK